MSLETSVRKLTAAKATTLRPSRGRLGDVEAAAISRDSRMKTRTAGAPCAGRSLIPGQGESYTLFFGLETWARPSFLVETFLGASFLDSRFGFGLASGLEAESLASFLGFGSLAFLVSLGGSASAAAASRSTSSSTAISAPSP